MSRVSTFFTADTAHWPTRFGMSAANAGNVEASTAAIAQKRIVTSNMAGKPTVAGVVTGFNGYVPLRGGDHVRGHDLAGQRPCVWA